MLLSTFCGSNRQLIIMFNTLSAGLIRNQSEVASQLLGDPLFVLITEHCPLFYVCVFFLSVLEVELVKNRGHERRDINKRVSCIALVESQKGVNAVQRGSVEIQKGVNAVLRGSVEIQKGVNAVLRGSVEIQKGAIAVQSLWR